MKTEEKCFRGKTDGSYFYQDDGPYFSHIHLPSLLSAFDEGRTTEGIEIEIIVRRVKKEKE